MRLKGARIERQDTGPGANSSCTGPSYHDSCCDGASNGGGSGRSCRREQCAARKRLALLGRVSSKFMLGSVLILLAAVPKQTGARRIADLDIPRNAQVGHNGRTQARQSETRVVCLSALPPHTYACSPADVISCMRLISIITTGGRSHASKGGKCLSPGNQHVRKTEQLNVQKMSTAEEMSTAEQMSTAELTW